MDLVPHLPVPRGITAWFGDFTWSVEKGPFRELWCQQLVPSVDEAVAQLEFLYPPLVLRQLTQAGHARLVYGLRGGLRAWVDEKLQLGADLACCPGWRERSKLVADLRSPLAYPRARVEIGIWAALHRLGLDPLVEPACDRSRKRSDWLVRVEGLRIAIELKTLSDPTYERDRTELLFVLAATVEEMRRGRSAAEIRWTLSEAIEGLMGREHVRFCLRQLTAIRDEIRSVSSQIETGGHFPLPTAGELSIHPANDSTSSYRVIGHDTDTERLVQRAAHKVHEAASQLGATSADLRVAVVLGSRDWLPSWLATDVAAYAREQFPEDPVDWVVVVNEGRLGDGTWMTDAVQAASRDARPLPDCVLQGLVEWGSQSSSLR